MKSYTYGHVKTALDSVRSAKWRSLLTMLGIIIGIVSVVTIVAIGEGVKRQVAAQIDHLGKGLITIRAGHPLGGINAGGINLFGTYNSVGALKSSDVTVVDHVPGVAQVAPLSILAGTATYNGHAYNGGMIIATTPELPTVLNQGLAYGGFFSVNEQNDNGAVIGSQVAQAMFGQDVPLGQSFVLDGQTFVVRGIFQDFGSAPLSLDANFNNAIFIPLPVAQTITNDNASIYEILVQPRNVAQVNHLAASLSQSLRKAHGGQTDFTVLKQSQTLSNTNKILDLLTRLISGVAAISLLVGGIGIMNVMLVSVTERMHEIGIRKAIGATSRQIMNQFLIEATVLSLLGAAAGIAVSFLVDYLLRLFTPLQPVITWQVVVLAVVVSSLVGIIFGTAPALKAARKDPIDALRNE